MSKYFNKGDDATIYAGLHPDLARVLDRAQMLAQTVPTFKGLTFTLIVGRRSMAAQAVDFAKGLSKLKFGAHNTNPARACDFLPDAAVSGHSVNWNSPAFRAVAHLILLAAHTLGIKVRWGGDWNRDGNEHNDGPFIDLDHIELDPWQSYGGVAAVPA